MEKLKKAILVYNPKSGNANIILSNFDLITTKLLKKGITLTLYSISWDYDLFTEILKNKNENEMYNQERLLVIDDPISSFDIENRIGILSYIKFQLNNFLNGHTETKSIILTHDIQTLYDLEKLVSEIINSCNQNHSEKFNFSILVFFIFIQLFFLIIS